MSPGPLRRKGERFYGDILEQAGRMEGTQKGQNKWTALSLLRNPEVIRIWGNHLVTRNLSVSLPCHSGLELKVERNQS